MSSLSAGEVRAEVERIRRVSDLLCSCHNILRDKYTRRALALDLAIMALTLWLTAMAFVEPHLGTILTPGKMSKDLWLGLVSVFAFFLAVVQFRVDWKGKSDAHARALQQYSRLKQEAGHVLAASSHGASEGDKLRELYRYAGETAVPIDDADFLQLKQEHRLKIAISKYLDLHPAASPTLLRIKMWLRDNLRKK